MECALSKLVGDMKFREKHLKDWRVGLLSWGPSASCSSRLTGTPWCFNKDNYGVLHLGWDNPTHTLGLTGCGATLQDETWASWQTSSTWVSNMPLWHLEPFTYMHYSTEKRLSKAFLPFLLALVRPHLESCVQFGAPSTRNIWTCWSMSRGCLGAGAQDVGEEKEVVCSALKSKGQRRLNCCLQLLMGVIAKGMGTDLAVHSDRARGHAAAQVNPRG